MVHPPVSLCPCIKGFPGEIRKKVRKLLYHSLRTNVARRSEKDISGFLGKSACFKAFSNFFLIP